jgi:hypothetical protein
MGRTQYETPKKKRRYLFIDIGVTIITSMHQVAINYNSISQPRKMILFRRGLIQATTIRNARLIFSMRAVSRKTAGW